MCLVYIAEGDITRAVEVDAVVTSVSSHGEWFGGVNQSIYEVSDQYHKRISQVLDFPGMYDGQVGIASGRIPHSGSFKDVIYVVDELKLELGHIVLQALVAAHDWRYSSIALPVFRSGIRSDKQAIVEQYRNAWKNFHSNHPETRLKKIYIVVYHDPEMVKLFGRYFPLHI